MHIYVWKTIYSKFIFMYRYYTILKYFIVFLTIVRVMI